MRGSFVLRNGKLVPKHLAPPLERKRATGFPIPMIRRDNIEPIQSMADGRTYDTLSGLRASYRPEGNPQGVEYTEIGDAERTDPVMPKVSKQECATLLDKFEAAVNRGEIS